MNEASETKKPVVWVPAMRESFAPLSERFTLREWDAAAAPAPCDTILMEPQDLKLLTLREAIRLSSQMPFVRWIILGNLRDAGVGRLPPGSHAVVPAAGTLDVEAFDRARTSLAGIGLQHMDLDWRAGGLSERALDKLFAVPSAGPTLPEVAKAIRSPTVLVTRAVMRATGMGYDTLRERRGMALMLACRAATGKSWNECGELVGMNPRTARRTLRELGLPFEGDQSVLLESARRILLDRGRPADDAEAPAAV